MKKQLRISLKLTSFVLVLALLAQLFTMNVFAQAPIPTFSPADTFDDSPAEIVEELEDLRTADTKHFRMSDGSMMMATYQIPVHFEDNGNWEEIDNTLTEIKDEQNQMRYENTAAGFDVSMAKNPQDEELISLSVEDFSISLTPLDKTGTTVAKIASPGDSDDDLVQDKVSSKLVYENIFKDTDMEYVVYPLGIKENIIVKKAQETYEYQFLLQCGDLTAELTDNVVCLKNADGDIIYTLDSPFMQDAADQVSTDIVMTLEDGEDGYVITVKPNAEWLNDADRTFPVAVDPQIKVHTGNTTFEGASVCTSGKYTSNPTPVGTVSGYASGTQYRTLMKFALPTLESFSTIVDAKLSIYSGGCYGGNNLNVLLYEQPTAWAASTVTWSDVVSVPSTSNVKAYSNFESGNSKYHLFDITNMVNGWYAGNPNNGIMLRMENENNSQGVLVHGASASFSSGIYPYVQIRYVNNEGLSGNWNFHDASLGRSGAMYVNDFTGQLVVTHDDVATTGNRMPMSISHVYNSSRYDDNDLAESTGTVHLGKGWRLNISKQIVPTLLAEYPYKYIDETGTASWFKTTNTPNVYESEDNASLQLTYNQNGTFSMGYGEDSGSVDFTSAGLYNGETDSNGDSITVTYTGKAITSVTDGVGRTTTLAYNGSGFLTAITDPANRTTSYAYTNGHLTFITYPDSNVTQFTYNVDDRLEKVIAIDGRTIRASYTSGLDKRVSTIQEYSSTGETGQKLDFSYDSAFKTTVSDGNGNSESMSFDKAGRLICATDGADGATYMSYADTAGAKNMLKYSSGFNKPIHNLLLNHVSPANLTGPWGVLYSSSGAGSASISNIEHYLGSSSLQVTLNSPSGYYTVTQDVNVIPAGSSQAAQHDKANVEVGKSYVLSAYVKSATGTAPTATMVLRYYNGSTPVDMDATTFTATDQWSRKDIFMIIPATAGVDKLQIQLGFVNSAGTVYFDCVQLEEGSAMGRYDLLSNGDFEKTTSNNPVSWTGIGGSVDLNVGVNGSRGLKMTGSPSAAKRMTQTLTLNGKAGDSFTFSGFGKADSVGFDLDEDENGTKYAVELTFHYTGGNDPETVTASFDPSNPDWQYVCSTARAEYDYSTVEIAVTYDYNANEAVFDNISLFAQLVGEILYYDDNGNLTAQQTEDYSYEYDYDNEDRITQMREYEKKKNNSQNTVLVSITNYTYDQNGNLLTEIKLDASNSQISKFVYTYDPNNNMLTSTEFDGANSQVSQSVYTYDAKDRMLTATHSDGTSSAYTYDSFGNQTSSEETNADGVMRSACTYTANGNYLASETDECGNMTEYDYDLTTGVLGSVTDPEGTETTYTYDADTDMLISVSGPAGVQIMTNTYGHTYDQLTAIAHNGTSYSFGYDAFGNQTSASVGNQQLASYHYAAHNGVLNYMQYGNGDRINYFYDSKGQLSSRDSFFGSYAWVYNNDGQLFKHRDDASNVVWKYGYDGGGQLENIVGTDGTRFDYTYADGHHTKTAYALYGSTYTQSYGYNTDGSLHDSSFNGQFGDSQSFDKWNRVSTYTSTTGVADTRLETEYTYLPGANAGDTTHLVGSVVTNKISSGVTTPVSDFSYSYDTLGNIVTIAENGTQKVRYAYDEQSQLTREDNLWLNQTITYAYDAGGNLTAKTEHAYTPGTPGAATTTHTYGYADANWTDKLTSYDGTTITYDAIGNPLNYISGVSMVWKDGRSLARVNTPSNSYWYRYNADGLRTFKNDNSGIITTYKWEGDRLVAQSNGIDTLVFIYDINGEITGFDHNGTTYGYYKNMQGDVLGIYNQTQQTVVQYTYDTWGAVVDISGSLASTVGAINPIRYRSYYYDVETGWYYLQSRYYDPEIGRFLNIDSSFDPGTGLLSPNLFAYCANNPVNLMDPSGCFVITAAVAAAIAAAAVALIKAICIAISVYIIIRLITELYKHYKSVSAAKAAATTIAKADTAILTKIKNRGSTKYWAANRQYIGGLSYVEIGAALTQSQALARVMSKKDVFAATGMFAHDLAWAATGVKPGKPEIDSGKAGVLGYYYHYHPKQAFTSVHIWFL